jgi:WD40 repeat protein
MKRLIIFIFCSFFSLSVLAQRNIPRIVLNTLGHSGKIYNILFTPDGQKLITISEDKSIKVWDAANGEMITKYETLIGGGPEGMLYTSAISSDGKLLAVAGYPVSTQKKNYIIIIDLEKGKQVSKAIGHSNVINTLTFLQSDNYLASGGDDGNIIIWKNDNKNSLDKVVTIKAGSRVSQLTYSNKASKLAAAVEDEDILLYTIKGLEEGITKFPVTNLRKHKGIVNKIAFSPEGDYLASSSFANELLLWNEKGNFLKELEKPVNVINALTFSHDSKILVALDVKGNGVSYAVPGGIRFSSFKGHDNTVFSAAFSPESLTGNYIVASAGGNNNEIYIWNTINGREQKKIMGKGRTVWDLEFGEGLQLYINNAQIDNPDYNRLFDFTTFTLKQDPGKPKTADANSRRRNVKQTGIYSISLPKNNTIQNDEFEDGRILDYKISPEGNILVASDFSLKVYNNEGFLLKEYLGHTGGVRAVAFSKDGRYIASGSEDQKINIWKTDDEGFAPSVREIFKDPVWSEYFGSLPVDSLTYIETTDAWEEVIRYLQDNEDKTYKDIQRVYSSIGEKVKPFFTLFISEDNEWVCWTPKGYFSCSSAGGENFGWHVDKGIDELADFYTAEQYFEILFRPEILKKSIQQGKRVEDILHEEGERIFDLSRLNKPSAGFFNTNDFSLGKGEKIHLQKGKYLTQSKSLPLKVDVYDGGGGIKEINIYQNEKLIIIDDTVKSIAEGEKITRSYNVDLINGQNDFKVVVKNYQNIESRPDHLSIEYTGEIIATSTLYILSVGINDYKNSAYNLNYAQPDAYSFTKKVIEKGSRMFKNVRKTEIYNTEATRENIMKGFESISSQAQPEDVFIFYYAGHGTLDEENDNQYYLVPTDVTKLYGDPVQLQQKGISATDLKNLLAEIKPQKQVILMDACHSGGAIKSMNVRGAASEEKAIVQLARASGVIMIASSGTEQFATEFKELKHGVFTYALLEALDGKADSGDKKVTVNEVKIYMEERVPALSEQYGGKAQYPTGFVHGNDFPISLILDEKFAENEQEDRE